MTTIDISLPHLQQFFLIFLRVSAIMISVPLFSSKSIPVIFKAGLSLSISIILFPILNLDNNPFHLDVISFGIGVSGEIVLGLIIGLSVRLVFAGIQLAGQIIGFQMGLAIANILDPMTSAQNSIIAQFYNIIAMLIFLAINAHYWFIKATVESFRLIPPFDFQFSGPLMEHLIALSGNMFIIAVKIGAPVIVAMLLTSVAFGLVARTVPQMHIFIVAMPVNIMVGLIFLAITIPYLSSFLSQIFKTLGNDIFLILKIVGN